MKGRTLAWAVAALMAAPGCRSAQQPAAGAREVADVPQPVAGVPAPATDHHTHLFGPAAVAAFPLLQEAPLAAVALPAGMERLLRAHEGASGDTAAAAALYTDDALVLDARNHAWVRGRRAAAGFLAPLFARPYRLTPVAYAADGATGQVAGYLTRAAGAAAGQTAGRSAGAQPAGGQPAAGQHFGEFLLTVRADAGGAWRIASEVLTFGTPPRIDVAPAAGLIAELDSAGIRRAAVLSVAYLLGSPLLKRPVADEAAQVRAENTWVADQAARYPDRLVAFCSVNPLRDYALAELARCAGDPRVRGMKLHFANSGVDLRTPAHVAAVRAFFAATNARRLALVVHVWTPDRSYGRRDAELFLREVLPAAPDVPVQIAHLAGSGPGFDAPAAFAVYAEAVAAGDPRTRHLYFDVATQVTPSQPAEVLAQVAARLRQVGLGRVLFGSDRAGPLNAPPRDAWAAFRRLPLTGQEFRTVAGNQAPYLR